MNDTDKQKAYAALLKLVAHFGSTKQAADILRIGQRTVQNWITDNVAKRTTPNPTVCRAIEAATNGEFKADQFRPDLEFVRTKRGKICFSRKRATVGGAES
jgi:DNA-binding transcriptional regulator YdaS (Cro superfamily)